MAATDIYRKTASGAAQLSERSVKLPPIARMALVMIDGVKPVSDLAAKLGAMGDLDGALAGLKAGGLIELVPAGTAAPPISGTASSAPVPAPAGAMSFEDLRKWTARHVSTAMGPMGDDYTMRIERAKTPEELVAAAEKARNAIGSFTTRAKEQVFWEQFQKNRGS